MTRQELSALIEAYAEACCDEAGDMLSPFTTPEAEKDRQLFEILKAKRALERALDEVFS